MKINELVVPTISINRKIFTLANVPILNEIDYSDGIEKLKLEDYGKPDSIILTSDLGMNFYILRDENKNSLVTLGFGHKINGYLPIHQLTKFSKIKGLSTQFLLKLVESGLKFVIQDSEPLTSDGKKWLINLINSGGGGLKLTNQDGNYPDAKIIENEWINAKFAIRDRTIWHGKTSIYVEAK